MDASTADGRADRYEAAMGWFQPTTLGMVQIGDIEIAAPELAAPLVVQMTRYDSMNVLCLYAASSDPYGTVAAENLNALRENVAVPQQCLTMGTKAVLVHNITAFRQRVIAAVNRENFSMWAGLVHYFDAELFSGELPDPIFWKRSSFAWQREYRFAIDRGVDTQEPYVLDVGPLDDICTIVDSASIQRSSGPLARSLNRPAEQRSPSALSHEPAIVMELGAPSVPRREISKIALALRCGWSVLACVVNENSTFRQLDANASAEWKSLLVIHGRRETTTPISGHRRDVVSKKVICSSLDPDPKKGSRCRSLADKHDYVNFRYYLS